MHGAKISRPSVHRITVAQVAVLVVVWLVLHNADPDLASSVIAGGAVAVVPHAWFAWRVFGRRGASSTGAVVKASYGGEITKFVLAAAGFALVFILLRPIVGWAVFAGYTGMLLIQLAGAWLLLR